MTPSLWAILLLRPFFLVFFVFVVAPVAWALYRVIPMGRLKVFLFRPRTGRWATPGDKAVMATAVLLSYVLLFSLVASFDIR